MHDAINVVTNFDSIYNFGAQYVSLQVPSVAKINGNSSVAAAAAGGGRGVGVSVRGSAAARKKNQDFCKTWKMKKLQKTSKKSIQIYKSVDF